MKERFSRLAPTEEPAAQTETNTFRFVFSNEKIGRDGHIVRNAGIQTVNYLRNNVVCWCHDDQQPPIGRGSNIDTSSVNCRIDVTFVSRDVLPFAGTIRDLVAGKWLRALSMSWQPIEWQYSTDRSRPGGIDFTAVDLLEVSVVPLPALPDALLDARSRGIDVAPLRTWAERALDRRSYRKIPRRQIEAIYRSTGAAVVVRRPRSYDDPARVALRARRARLREIEDRWERMERARRLRAGQAAHYAAADRAQLQTAQIHHKRALKHSSVLAKHHQGIADNIEELRAICERAMQTLSELGERRSAHLTMGRHLDALDRCVRALGEAQTDANDTLDDLGNAVGKAAACVNDVLDANAEHEPAEAAQE